jgi:hypothetical protein
MVTFLEIRRAIESQDFQELRPRQRPRAATARDQHVALALDIGQAQTEVCLCNRFRTAIVATRLLVWLPHVELERLMRIDPVGAASGETDGTSHARASQGILTRELERWIEATLEINRGARSSAHPLTARALEISWKDVHVVRQLQ